MSESTQHPLVLRAVAHGPGRFGLHVCRGFSHP
jgi:hypothetical protein